MKGLKSFSFHFKALARMLQHGPLALAPVPRFGTAGPKGMGAVVPVLVFKITEMKALDAPNLHGLFSLFHIHSPRT